MVYSVVPAALTCSWIVPVLGRRLETAAECESPMVAKSNAVMDGVFLHRMEYQRTRQGISAPPAVFEDFSVDGTLV
jgi:hypothetical protein